MKKEKKNKESKQPSFLQQVIAIYYEQALKKKAQRILEKQVWSADFLSMILSRAAKRAQTNLSMDIVSPNGTRLVITALYNDIKQKSVEDDIFDHLDDSTAVNDFINAHRRK